MIKQIANARMVLFAFPISALSLAISSITYAQEETSAEKASEDNSEVVIENSFKIQNPLEEVLTIGRLKSAAADVLIERMDNEVAVDLITSETIGRIGDSTVGDAIKRIPGATLVDGKFVFVRGLGERYSSTLLNGAVIPSPDLTRSVVPLDLFPTSLVESLAIQKVFSADMPAAFGGGSVDIRTKSIPDGLLFNIEIGSGAASNGSDFYSYSGGGKDNLGEDDGTRALSSNITNALARYRGDFSAQNIQFIDGLDTINDARDVNRALAISLNRDVSIEEDSGSPDVSAAVNLGNSFDLGKGFEFGVLAGLKYGSSWRNREIVNQGLRFLDTGEPEDVSYLKRTTHNVSVTGNLTAGLRFGEEHLIQTTSLFLRNTDDLAEINDVFDNDAPVTEGVSNRFYNIRYENREMIVNQIQGEHEFGYDSRDVLGLESLNFLDGLSFDWYYSDGESTTDIPNEVLVSGASTLDPFSPFELETQAVSVERDSSAADFRFTKLEDYVESYGSTINLPVSFDRYEINISAGSEYWQKVRTYRQTQFGLGSVSTSAPLQGLPGGVFSDENILNSEFGYQITRTGSNSESYQASSRVQAGFGQLDVLWNEKLRVVLGARWEDYQQVGLDWDPYDFNGSQLIPDDREDWTTFTDENGNDTNAVAQYFNDATFIDDRIYPSLALTYMKTDFWAEDFQLRLSYGETTVRPDLREITDSSYIDPITNFLVFGNSDLVPAQFKNYDLRAEWFFGNGNNFTVSLFYKDILDPIDQAEAAAGDNAQALELINTESAEITGIELEFKLDLATVSDKLQPFFVQGNMTLLDTETIVGAEADAATNNARELLGASDALNLIFGFDSFDDHHSATLSYNLFSERLFFAGRNGQDDVFEQPFNSLDITYSYYPLDQVIIEAKIKNVLGDETVLERSGVSVYREEKPQTFSLSFKYNY